MDRVRSLRELRISSPVSNLWMDALLKFVSWSQGKTPLQPALEGLALYFGAEVVCLSRRERANDSMRHVLAVDIASETGFPNLLNGFAKDVLGETLDKLKPGTAVSVSEVHPEAMVQNAELARWSRKRRINEIVVFCIGSRQGTREIIEFHFSKSAPYLSDVDAAHCAEMLAKVFKGRREGLVEQLILGRALKRKKHMRRNFGNAILSPENPAKLTRAEWRLCVLVANGMSREGAAKALSVTPNTIRSHLRNIYSKTERETYHELALHLTSVKEQSHLLSLPFTEAA